MDAMMEEINPEDIPQRPYEPLPDDPQEQWRIYNERMAKKDAERAKEREERKRKFEEERIKAEEELRRKKEEEANRPKTAAEIAGTTEWFAARMAGQIVNTFDYIRVNATEEQLPKFLKIAIMQLVTASGDTFRDDKYINAYIPLVAKWMRTHVKMGLILRGNVGVGKTTIAKAISAVYNICNGRGFRVFDAVELSRIAKDDDKTFREICNYPMLGIDDLGIEPSVVKNYGNETTPIVELIMHRHARRMFTIITTNLAVNEKGEDEIYSRYGKRIGDRLDHLCNTLKFDGNQKSYRQHE